MALILKLYIYNTNDLVMKTIKQITSLFLMLMLMASFSQCSTAQKLQKKAPMNFGDTYAQKWVAGIKGGGSGINIFIPVDENNIALDSIYFRDQMVKLKYSENDKMYVGRFKTEFNQPVDMIVSSDMKEESKNTYPIIKQKMPFEMLDNECVVTYSSNDKTMYYKISNISIKEPVHYPSAPKGQ